MHVYIHVHVHVYDTTCVIYVCVGGRTFLIVNNSSLMKLAQMYEFTAESPREKKRSVLCTAIYYSDQGMPCDEGHAG